MCACSYESEECHGLFCCYYLLLVWRAISMRVKSFGPHWHLHTQTHNIPTDSTAVGRMLRFITMLFYDWSFVQESECWNVCMNIIRINNLSFSQLSQEEHTKMSERREKKSIFLSSLLVSFPLLPHICLFYLIFDKISLAYLHTSLTPPLHPLSLSVCIPLLFSLLFSSFHALSKIIKQ